MADDQHDPSQTPDLPPPFLEVTCTSTGRTLRFAPGTKAGFAVSLINAKIGAGVPTALYIEAAKDGEEPISFGSSSVLVGYGKGWKLQTVVDNEGVKQREGVKANTPLTKKQVPGPVINLFYIGKILLAFVFIFLLGGTFTLALENLPRLMLLINSSL